MTLLALPSIKKTGENSNKPTNNFAQIHNKLMDLSMTGTKDTPAAAFHTLAFIIRLHPDIPVTPESISRQLEIRATTHGGKYKKPKTIRLEFGQLCKAGFMKKVINSDSNGGSLPSQYLINYEKIYGGGAENSAPPNFDDNDKKNKEKPHEGGGAENSAPPYNKERASIYNTSDNTQKQQQPKKPVVVFLFDKKIESAIKDRPDIERGWIEDSLKLPNQSVENVLMAINKSETADNPTAFIRAALKKGWKFDTQKRQSLTKPSSDKNRAINQKKYMAIQEAKNKNFDELKSDFIEKFKTNAMIYNYYSNLEDDRLKDDGEFHRFAKERYETDNQRSQNQR